MRVMKLHLTDFRGIHDITFEFGDRMNLLVGENGSGKTSILNALAILLSRFIWRIRTKASTGRMFAESDVRTGAGRTLNHIWVEYGGKPLDWSVGKSRLRSEKQTLTNQLFLNKCVKEIQSIIETKPDIKLPLAMFYSVNRGVFRIPLRIRKKHVFEPLAAYDDALTDERYEADFKLFFEWFRNREDLENENLRYRGALFKPDNWEYPDRQLAAVRSALHQLMPEFSQLQVRRNPLRMIVKKGNDEFQIEQLSNGEKCLLALVGDLARRFAIANPGMENPLEGQGVVMIDEVDLHLHPRWQRMVIPKLLETFPRCQFILTTHSPQVISHVRPEDLFLLHQEGSEITCTKPAESFGKTSDRILEDLMYVTARPPEIENQLAELFRLIERKQLTDAKSLIKNLRDQIKADPELLRAELMIQRKEIVGK